MSAGDKRDKPCTVSQMIEALSALPSHALLYTRGYEEGWHDATLPQPIEVVRNHYDEWYYGPHTEADYGTEGEPRVSGFAIGGA